MTKMNRIGSKSDTKIKHKSDPQKKWMSTKDNYLKLVGFNFEFYHVDGSWGSDMILFFFKRLSYKKKKEQLK